MSYWLWVWIIKGPLYFTILLSIENSEKVPRSLCTRFIFILLIMLVHCSLGHDHHSSYVCSVICLCSCTLELTAVNCHYALWCQISHVPVTLLWRECFYWAIMKLDALHLNYLLLILLCAHMYSRVKHLVTLVYAAQKLVVWGLTAWSPPVSVIYCSLDEFNCQKNLLCHKICLKKNFGCILALKLNLWNWKPKT